jgi:hypothetical protein
VKQYNWNSTVDVSVIITGMLIGDKPLLTSKKENNFALCSTFILTGVSLYDSDAGFLNLELGVWVLDIGDTASPRVVVQGILNFTNYDSSVCITTTYNVC